MAGALLRPRPGRDLAQTVFPPVQADRYRVTPVLRHDEPVQLALWCDGQHAHWEERHIAIAPAGDPLLSDLFAAGLEHEVRFHR